MNARLNEIKKTFEQNGIIIKDELNHFKKTEMKESITNQFMKVEDITGDHYLIRMNGKLWPPFTRDSEDFNLKRLEKNQIPTTVLANNTELGFQICRLLNDKNRVGEMPVEAKKDNSLKKIALGIKRFHQVGHFRNTYPIANTINNSLARIPESEQKRLHPYYGEILKMLSTLNSDEKNRVSSHNDLLPSSIYLNKNQVSFVDWEYSAENHRSYDVCVFSIKFSLTQDEEYKLVNSYDESGDLDMQYSVALMKPVVNFLLLLWNLSSKQANPLTASTLLHSLTVSMQDAIYKQSAKTLLTEMKFRFFHQRKQDVKFISDENVLNKYNVC